jgi:hypothetical protein
MRQWTLPARFLAGQALLGVGVGWSILAALITLDIAGIGTLLRDSETGSTTLSLLILQFGAGFAVFVTATSMSFLPDPERQARLPPDLRPIPVQVRHRR